jgi:threonine/homoserine/homoserine lactone efflux protein
MGASLRSLSGVRIRRMSYIPNPLIIPVGMLIGVLVALPIGPVNLLGLQRAVERGYFGGLAMGIGILLGDGLIALVAALGVNAVKGAMQDYRTVIQIIGGLALMVAGVRLYYQRPAFVSPEADAKASLADFVWDIPAAFVLTITYPGAVIGLMAIFGGASTFVEVESYIDAFTMAASVMGGSFCYWLVVSRLISRVRHGVEVGWLERANRIAGLILAGLGALFIAEMAVKQLATWWYAVPIR